MIAVSSSPSAFQVAVEHIPFALRHEGTIVDTPTTIHVTQVILCSGAAGLG
jgi:hypothetical protein